MNADLYHAAVQLARRQHGVVTRQQLLELGVSPGVVKRWRREGRLCVVHRGVYLVGAVMPPWAAERAALLACGPDAVLSHWTAARMLGLPVPGNVQSDVVYVTIPVSGGCRRARVRAYRSGRLNAAEVQRLHDMPVTTTSRTLLDLAVPLARDGSRRRLEQLVAAAFDQRLTTEARLRQVLDRHASRRGAGLLRLILDQAGGPRLARSEAEEELLRLIRAGRLALPRTNARVAGREVDFLWQQERLVVEVDGYAWHSSRNRFENDRDRDAALAAAGFTVLRVTWRRIADEPLVVVARIAFMLGRLTLR
jgi:very-short-patch-repair endonuclease